MHTRAPTAMTESRSGNSTISAICSGMKWSVWGIGTKNSYTWLIQALNSLKVLHFIIVMLSQLDSEQFDSEQFDSEQL